MPVQPERPCGSGHEQGAGGPLHLPASEIAGSGERVRSGEIAPLDAEADIAEHELRAGRGALGGDEALAAETVALVSDRPFAVDLEPAGRGEPVHRADESEAAELEVQVPTERCLPV